MSDDLNAGGTLPAGCVRNDDGTVTVPLGFPVQGSPDSVVMARLNGRAMVDVMNAKGDGDRAERMVLGSLGFVGPKGAKFISDLDGQDFITLSEVAGGFLENGRRAGPSSSQDLPAS
ncbi:hypothetical protein [Acetobacter fallax]|uniref:Uncharacterized protein n=1 Tax=Acetobacter fallax TaxID=1737473 RepID=A0ABX0KAZ6_9PROT|nr:hypothetical protein [Acetobacter fallax]NHO33331.1 hypothetical protein [Acetobacter fallax]NHO36952.1 hypothetical protein [Acetobacter fallax]